MAYLSHKYWICQLNFSIWHQRKPNCYWHTRWNVLISGCKVSKGSSGIKNWNWAVMRLAGIPEKKQNNLLMLFDAYTEYFLSWISASQARQDHKFPLFPAHFLGHFTDSILSLRSVHGRHTWCHICLACVLERKGGWQQSCNYSQSLKNVNECLTINRISKVHIISITIHFKKKSLKQQRTARQLSLIHSFLNKIIGCKTCICSRSRTSIYWAASVRDGWIAAWKMRTAMSVCAIIFKSQHVTGTHL